jgi:DNA-binding CsgD family transcriptional regulator
MGVDANPSVCAALSELDIRRLVGLMGQISGLNVDLAQKKRLLLTGVCELIEGDGWAWSLTKQLGDRAVVLDAASGGNKDVLPKWKALLGVGQSRMAQPMLRDKAKDGSGKAAPPVAKRPSKKQVTVFTHELPDDIASRLIFGRRADQQAFSPREEEMVRIVIEEVGWLHELNPVCTSLDSEIHLSPRQKETLNFLAEGLSDKAISERLQISAHTVRDYIKSLYNIYGINSRAELMKRLGSGESK